MLTAQADLASPETGAENHTDARLAASAALLVLPTLRFQHRLSTCLLNTLCGSCLSRYYNERVFSCIALDCVTMGTNHTAHSFPATGHLGCFQPEAVMSNAAVNRILDADESTCVLAQVYPELQGSRVFNFDRNCQKPSPKWLNNLTG